MAPFFGLLIKLLLPVAVAEVQKRLADKRDPSGVITRPQDIPLSEAALPAIKAVTVGSVSSKTAWFSLALMILGFLEQNQQFVSSIVPTPYLGYAIAGIGAVAFFLRAVTTESIVAKGE